MERDDGSMVKKDDNLDNILDNIPCRASYTRNGESYGREHGNKKATGVT